MSDIVIEVTTEVLVGEADTVLEMTKNIESYFNEIKSAVDRSSVYWKGDAADAHRSTYSSYSEEINGIISRFKDNAESLKKIALGYAEKEMQVTQISNGLPSDIIY